MSARPHILVICTDQHRFDAVGTHPGSVAITPNLLELSRRGTVFEHCYAPNPVCSPTRASMLTGEYPSSHGLWANGVTLPDSRSLVSRELADAGYRCGLVGKFHLGAAFQGRTEERLDDGFETYEWAHDPFHGSPDNAYHQWLQERHPDLWAEAMGDVVTPELENFTHANTLFDEMPTQASYTTWVTERTSAFLEDADDRPFFLLANYFAPHHPFAAPPEYFEKYPPGSVPPPVGGVENLASKPARQRDASVASYRGHGPSFQDFTSEQIDEIRRTYYAMISQVDDGIGQLLDVLRSQGLERDTLVIFVSDHGEMLGDHALLLKGPMLYDPAVRVPLIVSWPEHVPAGHRVRDFVGVHDVARTIRAAAGLEAYERDQGLDLTAVTRGERNGRRYAWAEYRDSGYPYDPPAMTTMYRTEEAKVVIWHGDPDAGVPQTGELYDLTTDPDELVNHWDDPDYRDLRLQLSAEALDLEVRHEDRHAPRVAPW
ncbi:sulfatase [Ruania zhangjianzhongii]|uniref:sulfatase family protein n=1 Tax=Ruania zhangjianzhongii TaxID=2603206 RepID=UPI0011C767CA|nr:sulfatase-like hydrolase/transferase [Ruania zhangjianzhongii]